jgi:SAM-dependent methyltransferase
VGTEGRRFREGTMLAVAEAKSVIQQRQPPGVPPLEMTGERTLPDVPQENYWYQRHVVVYEWIAGRVTGKRVVDLACGEGYGAVILAESAAEVVGVDANPETYEHARLKYQRANLRFTRELVEEFASPVDVAVFLQTIEHVRNPEDMLRHFGTLVADAGGEVIVSTPNLLTLAGPGEAKSGNPWHIKEYEPEDFYQLLERHFAQVDLYGLYHARKMAAFDRGARALSIDPDVLHRRDGRAQILRGMFVSAIGPADFRIRRVALANELADAQDLVAVLRN